MSSQSAPDPSVGASSSGPVDRDIGRVALAPAGQTLEERGIGLGRRGMDGKLGQHRPGVGQHHADAQARARRLRTDRGEPERAALGREGRDRTRVRLRPTLHAFGARSGT